MDNKPAVALYAGGALTLIWLSSAIVGAIGSVPLVRHSHLSIQHVCALAALEVPVVSSMTMTMIIFRNENNVKIKGGAKDLVARVFNQFH